MSALNEGVLERLKKLVEGLGIEDDDMITEIIIIAKTSSMGRGRVGICYNYDTKDWVIRRGMLDAVVDLETQSELIPNKDNEED